MSPLFILKDNFYTENVPDFFNASETYVSFIHKASYNRSNHNFTFSVQI